MEEANNKYLIEKIREYSKSKIILPKREIIDFKESDNIRFSWGSKIRK